MYKYIGLNILSLMLPTVVIRLGGLRNKKRKKKQQVGRLEELKETLWVSFTGRLSSVWSFFPV